MSALSLVFPKVILNTHATLFVQNKSKLLSLLLQSSHTGPCLHSLYHSSKKNIVGCCFLVHFHCLILRVFVSTCVFLQTLSTCTFLLMLSLSLPVTEFYFAFTVHIKRLPSFLPPAWRHLIHLSIPAFASESNSFRSLQICMLHSLFAFLFYTKSVHLTALHHPIVVPPPQHHSLFYLRCTAMLCFFLTQFPCIWFHLMCKLTQRSFSTVWANQFCSFHPTPSSSNTSELFPGKLKVTSHFYLSLLAVHLLLTPLSYFKWKFKDSRRYAHPFGLSS